MNSTPKPFTEEDIRLVADSLPGFVAGQHGCLPEDCDLTCDMSVEDWQGIARAVLRVLAEAGRLQPQPGTDYFGDALDLYVETGAVVGMRRFGPQIKLGINTTVVNLDAKKAETVGASLLAAAKLARDEQASWVGSTPQDHAPDGLPEEKDTP